MGFPVQPFLLCLSFFPESSVSGLTPQLEYDFEQAKGINYTTLAGKGGKGNGVKLRCHPECR